MFRSALYLCAFAAIPVMGHAQTSTVTTGPNGVSGGTTITRDGKPCKVIHSDNSAPGTMSSSVTAGPGGVSSSTSSGPSVTVRSGDGQSRSSSTATGTTSNGTTTMTTSDGECVVVVPKDSK